MTTAADMYRGYRAAAAAAYGVKLMPWGGEPNVSLKFYQLSGAAWRKIYTDYLAAQGWSASIPQDVIDAQTRWDSLVTGKEPISWVPGAAGEPFMNDPSVFWKRMFQLAYAMKNSPVLSVGQQLAGVGQAISAAAQAAASSALDWGKWILTGAVIIGGAIIVAKGAFR